MTILLGIQLKQHMAANVGRLNTYAWEAAIGNNAALSN